MTGVLTRRRNWTQTQKEGEDHLQDKERGCRRNQTWGHLDSGLLAFRIVRKYPSIVLCHGSANWHSWEPKRFASCITTLRVIRSSSQPRVLVEGSREHSSPRGNNRGYPSTFCIPFQILSAIPVSWSSDQSSSSSPWSLHLSSKLPLDSSL